MRKGLIAFVLAIAVLGFFLLYTKNQDPLNNEKILEPEITENTHEPIRAYTIPDSVSGDHVNVTSLYLHPTANPNTTFSILDPSSEITSVFGPPVRTSAGFSEMFNGNLAEYMYNGLTISYLNGRQFGSHITSALFSLKIASHGSFKVGDNINQLQSVFPNSFQLKKDKVLYVSLLSPNGLATDSQLVFTYNDNNIITSIIVD